ncbi:DNA helicase [Serratia phage MQ-4]|nr:DNA helicase [Serratia phage MQ-4]
MKSQKDKLFDALQTAQGALMNVRQAKAVLFLKLESLPEGDEAYLIDAVLTLVCEAETQLDAVQQIGMKDDAPEAVPVTARAR